MRRKRKTPEAVVADSARALFQPGHLAHRPDGLEQQINRLLGLPADARDKAFERSFHRLRNRATVDLLLERCSSRWHADADEALGLAQLAERVASSLSTVEETGGPAMAMDARALAAAYVGNCWRLLRRWALGEKSFARADKCSRRGSCDPEVAARIGSLHASLRRDSGDFLGALELLRMATKLYASLGDEHSQGRTLLKVATVLERAGRPDAAIRTHFIGCGLLDDGPPAEAAAAWINLACFLTAADRPREACGVLDGLAGILESVPSDSSIHLSAAWVEGLALHGTGHHGEAAVLLLRSSWSYEKRGDPENAALCRLDLARVYFHQGDAEALRLALEPLSDAPARLSRSPEAAKALQLLVFQWRGAQVSLAAIEGAAKAIKAGRRG